MTISTHRGNDVTGKDTHVGTVEFVHPDGYAFIVVDGLENDSFCPPHLVESNNLKEDDEIEFVIGKGKSGRESVTRIISVNGEKKAEKSESITSRVTASAAKAAKKVLFYIPFLARTKLHLAFTAGGQDKRMVEKLAAAQQSLQPYLDYTQQSIHAAEHQRKVLRFNWSHVPESIELNIKPEYTTMLAEVDCFSYRSPIPDLQIDEVLYAADGESINKITNIGTSLEDGAIPFNTKEPLESQSVWDRLDHDRQGLDYSTIMTVIDIEKASADGEPIEILTQSVVDNQLEIIIEGRISPSASISLNDAPVEVTVVPTPMHGILKDSASNVIVRENSIGTTTPALSFPESEIIFDEANLPYSWTRSGGKGRNRRFTLKLELHSDVASQVNVAEDNDPYDMIFSPNRELKKMEIEGSWSRSAIAKKLNEIKVYRRDLESTTIVVDRIPDEGTVLTSAPRTRLLRAQKDMIEELKLNSCPHNRSLLKLLAPGDISTREDIWEKDEPSHPKEEPKWMELTQDTDGTEQQKEMVRIALSSRDFSILQGPPGSGKSTTILEIVLQLVLRGENVLLCGSTQASIDNVLSRIIRNSRYTEIISPVRIGNEENIYDEQIKPLSLSALQRRMREVFDLSADEAKGLILSSSNLTCGTMEGILGHPWIRDSRSDYTDKKGYDRSRIEKSPQPHWDVLIIDECSKTTFNEFIVPAMFCQRFILVGDIRQLPPFTQEGEFKANLENIKNFDSEGQRAMLLNRSLNEISSPGINDPSILLVEKTDVIDKLLEEWSLRDSKSLPKHDIILVTSSDGAEKREIESDSIRVYSAKQVLENFEIGIDVMTSSIIIADDASLKRIQSILPMMPVAWGHKVRKNDYAIASYRSQPHTNHPKFKRYERDSKGRRKVSEWSYEMSWRLARLSQLKHSKNDRTIEHYEKGIGQLMPHFVNITSEVDLIRLIALPSVMECIQEGFQRRSSSEATVESTLTHGMPSNALDKRFKMLDFQHRMEPGISAFPRDEFYKGEALIDANTIEERNQSTPFNYRQNNPSSIWLNVPGNRDQRGGNKMEVKAVVKEILKAIEWARENPPQHGTWEFAILTPYSAQYIQLVSAVKKLTGIGHRSFRFDLSEMKKPAPVTLFVSTTDKFQGQEADLVIISLVQTRGYGFLDSPNRMNVALTRARRKRIIIGRHDNFVGCRDEMLRNMAKVHTDAALVKN